MNGMGWTLLVGIVGTVSALILSYMLRDSHRKMLEAADALDGAADELLECEEEAALLRLAVSGVDAEVEKAALVNARDQAWFRVVLTMLVAERRERMELARRASSDRELNQAVGAEAALEEFQQLLVRRVNEATKAAKN